MKKSNKVLSFILAAATVTSCTAFGVAAKETNADASYSVDLVYNVDEAIATATISVSGGLYRVGRFGFNYDPTALVLLNSKQEAYNVGSDKLSDIVVGAKVAEEYTVKTTEETNLTSNLVNTDDGTILFAWYADTKIDAATNADVGYIDAGESAKEVATVYFALSEDLKKSDNPAEEFLKIENIITPATKDNVPDGVKGWNDVSYATEDANGKTIIENIEITTSVTADMAGIKVTATPDTDSITVSWQPIETETTAKIKNYNVTVSDKNGTKLAERTVDATEENLNKNKYSVKFTSADGIEPSTKYTVTVTPVTQNGNNGASASVSVTTKSVNATGGDSSSSTTNGGASLTYTVKFVAGDGSIPEGQKFKYTVKRNGYVSGSPSVIPPEGKVFAGWSVDGETLVSVEVYKITKNVTFKAFYVENEEDTHRTFIVGYPDGEVKAERSLTRAEAAAIIARASSDFDENKEYTSDFTDVAYGSWYYNYVSYVYKKGIVTGYENHTFAPDDKITRAEFATIMQRYKNLELNEEATFGDIEKSYWAVSYIGACKTAGLIDGYEDGTFRPENEITRAEAVKILNRAADRAPTPKSIDAYIKSKGIPFEDLQTSVWYFYEIMEAAFPHLISYYH